MELRQRPINLQRIYPLLLKSIYLEFILTQKDLCSSIFLDGVGKLIFILKMIPNVYPL